MLVQDVIVKAFTFGTGCVFITNYVVPKYLLTLYLGAGYSTTVKLILPKLIIETSKEPEKK